MTFFSHCRGQLFPVLRAAGRRAAGALLAGAALGASAQGNGLLYDPEPPADSSYVRVINAAGDGAVDVLVDGKPRVRNLAAGDAGNYLVLPAGRHGLNLVRAGKSAAVASTTLEVSSGRAISVAFTALRADARPLVFEDKANSNKLKAVLAVYHLDSRSGALDVLTADGSTKVFAGVAPGTSSALSVNPIQIELMAVRPGEKSALAKAPLAMAQGGTYSLLLLPGEGGRPSLRALQNKVERYTGKP